MVKADNPIAGKDVVPELLVALGKIKVSTMTAYMEENSRSCLINKISCLVPIFVAMCSSEEQELDDDDDDSDVGRI
jgi:hypothetical protein